MQDVSDDLSAVESRWLSSGNKPANSAQTPDGSGGDMDGYSRNLQHMNDSLQVSEDQPTVVINESVKVSQVT